MPSRRRRQSLRSSNLPVRITAFRPSSDQLAATSRSASGSPSRFVPPAQSRAAQLAGYRHEFPAAASVTEERLSLTLPIPPSINHQYATVKGRRLLSSAGRAYKTEVGRQVWITLAQSPIRAYLMERLQSEPLAFSVRFFFTTALRRDVDSGLKIAQDAICEGLGLNDNRIVETHLYKSVDKLHPRIEVSLSLASPSSHTS